MVSAVENMAANTSWSALGKATDLRNRILFTLVCLHRTATLRATALATLKTAVMCT